MKKKATLLIQHLESIYPMVFPFDQVIHDGYIAIHHDKILSLGLGEGKEWIEKDTRILEGRGNIAFPGFIDVDVCFSDHMEGRVNDWIKLYETGNRLLKNGTMIVGTEPIDETKRSCLRVEPVVKTRHRYPIVHPLHPAEITKSYRRFCISSAHLTVDCLDQLQCAKLYALWHPELSETQILAACCVYPARALRLRQVGQLRPSWKANVLMSEGRSFSDVLNRWHGSNILQVIKNGVRIYPYLLI